MTRSRRNASKLSFTFLIGACALGAVYQGIKWSRSKPIAKPSETPSITKAPEKIEPTPAVNAAPESARVEAAGKIDALMALGPAPTTAPVTRVEPAGPILHAVAFGAPLQPQPTQSPADAKAKLSAGDLLGARKLLNDVLLGGSLSASEMDSIKTQIAELNRTIVFSPKTFSDDPFVSTYTVKGGDKLNKIASDHNITWELLCRLNGLTDPKKLRSGKTIKIINGPFHAVVNKSTFRMDLYLGGPGTASSTYIATYSVGLGKDDSTPTGTWMVEPHKKIKNPTYYSPRGEGVIAADDPKNPLGEFWIGLSGVDGHAAGKASYGIHGTIEPESIGKMSSMGCIRMKNEDVAMVFELLIEGKSTVVVKD